MLVCSLLALFKVQVLNHQRMDCRNIHQCIITPHLKRQKREYNNFINSLWVSLILTMVHSDLNRTNHKKTLQCSSSSSSSSSSILLCSSSSDRLSCQRRRMHCCNRRHILVRHHLYLILVQIHSSVWANNTINSQPHSSCSGANYCPGSSSFCSSFYSSIRSSSSSSRCIIAVLVIAVVVSVVVTRCARGPIDAVSGSPSGGWRVWGRLKCCRWWSRWYECRNGQGCTCRSNAVTRQGQIRETVKI